VPLVSQELRGSRAWDKRHFTLQSCWDIVRANRFQKAGLGHGFLPRIRIRKELQEKSLVELSVEDPLDRILTPELFS
jgi:hypothetical protein